MVCFFCFSSSYSPERVQQIEFNLFQFNDYVRDHFSTFQWNQTIVDDLQALYRDGERNGLCQAFQVCASVDWCVKSLSFQDHSNVNNHYISKLNSSSELCITCICISEMTLFADCILADCV